MDSEKNKPAHRRKQFGKSSCIHRRMALEPLERRQGILLERTRLLETRKLETHNRELSESHRNQSKQPGQTSL